jgi:hypothetical protein
MIFFNEIVKIETSNFLSIQLQNHNQYEFQFIDIKKIYVQIIKISISKFIYIVLIVFGCVLLITDFFLGILTLYFLILLITLFNMFYKNRFYKLMIVLNNDRMIEFNLSNSIKNKAVIAIQEVRRKKQVL